MKATEKKLSAVRAEIAEQMKTPEFWQELAGHRFPGKRGLTAWFAYSVVPVRAGWYERFFINFTERQYWDGQQWLADGSTPYRAVSEASFWPCWRGLTRST